MQIEKLVSDIKNQSSHTLDFLLQNDVESTLSKSGIKIRKVFSPVLRKIYSTQTEYTLVKENVPKQACIKKGKIFIINHRQADDIVLGVNAVGESGYVVFGNKYLALDTINGWGLWGHGVILLDRNDSRSRKSTYDKIYPYGFLILYALLFFGILRTILAFIQTISQHLLGKSINIIFSI